MIGGKEQSEKPWYKKAIYGCIGAAKRMRAWYMEGWAIGAGMNLAPRGLEPYPPLSPCMQPSC